MKRTLRVLNGMVRDGILESYAIAGAVAAFNYVEATLTEDLDVLVMLPGRSGSGLVVLTPLLGYLASRGYTEFEKEGLVIEGWPVQFLPVSDPLDAEALREAQSIDYRLDALDDSPEPLRVISAEHVVAMALRLGRPKDHIRVAQFLEQSAVDLVLLREVLRRHGLVAKWAAYCRRAGIEDPITP